MASVMSDPQHPTTVFVFEQDTDTEMDLFYSVAKVTGESLGVICNWNERGQWTAFFPPEYEPIDGLLSMHAAAERLLQEQSA